MTDRPKFIKSADRFLEANRIGGAVKSETAVCLVRRTPAILAMQQVSFTRMGQIRKKDAAVGI
jgi:hypothetical protein